MDRIVVGLMKYSLQVVIGKLKKDCIADAKLIVKNPMGGGGMQYLFQGFNEKFDNEFGIPLTDVMHIDDAYEDLKQSYLNPKSKVSKPAKKKVVIPGMIN